MGYTYISFECNRNVCMCSQLHKPLCAQILNYSQRNFLFDFEYLRYWKKISTYFLKLIPNHPAWRKVKMQPWEVMGEKLVFIRSRDQCSAKRKRRFHLPVRWGIGLGYDLRYWLGSGLGSGFGSEIMSRDCSLVSDLVKACSYHAYEIFKIRGELIKVWPSFSGRNSQQTQIWRSPRQTIWVTS